MEFLIYLYDALCTFRAGKMPTPPETIYIRPEISRYSSITLCFLLRSTPKIKKVFIKDFYLIDDCCQQ